MYNIVSIDPSLVSTGVVVGIDDDFKLLNYCREKDAYGKKGFKKWYKFAEEHVEYNFVEYRTYEDYSEGEMVKLMDYDKITTNIVKDILKYIKPEYPTKIIMEGYNFGAQVGDLLDLVTFSSLLRKKLFDDVSEDLLIVSPSTLKLESCKLTYEPIIKVTGKRVIRKKEIWKNNLGIPGGSFTKPDILLAIVENKDIDDYWIKHCKEMKDDLTSVKTIPKPYEDVNDAYILYRILHKKHIN